MKMSSHWPLLALALIQLAGCTENNIDVSPVSYEPSWRYRCVTDEGCLRSEYPNGARNTTFLEYDSLDLCRTLCGRFGGIWPKPLSAALSTQTVKIHPNYLRFNLQNAPAETRSLLVEMTHVVTGNLMAECGGNVTEVVDTPIVVDIVVTSPSLELSWDTNEQYSLDISSKKGGIAVHISADTVYGARHGLESFTHLVTSDRAPYTTDQTCSLHLVSGAKIKDRPVYKHRGFLLDTSRNFIPMKDIKRMVDAMATTKMNVFHWHVTDSHSFPLESRRVPLLTKYGAYSENEIYNAEQVREFIRYAQIRGVRVVIEIDAPAHAGNGWQWGKDMPGYGDLAVCVNQQPWRDSCIQPPCGQLNPANPVMYNVLKDLYRDVADYLIKPALFHMGGDEVFFPCWESNEEIRNYMKAQGFNATNLEGFMDLWGEFHKKTLDLWDEVMVENEVEKKQPVLLWSSDLTQANRIRKYLDKERYVIQVWEPENSPLLSQLINLGYKTISIPKDVWYMDHGFWGVTKYGNWRRMYNYNLPKNILGGEVAMWTEYVDSQNLDSRTWPRAAAVAERLWSDPTARAQAAEPRMQRLRSRLAARGLRPDAIAPEWCAQHDGKCL